jgi:hypothetical protein
MHDITIPLEEFANLSPLERFHKLKSGFLVMVIVGLVSAGFAY